MYGDVTEHHEHEGTTQLKLSYEYLDFENSKQKDDGKRYGVEIDHQNAAHHVQLYFEHTDTQTKPHISKDLSVDKTALKYQYQLDKQNTLHFSYIHLSDNLIDAVDNGNIYGFGYKYKALTLTQYLSEYKDFSVYQTDVKWGMKRSFDDVAVMGAVVGKYIYLKDRQGNDYTKKAKDEYYTVGLKVHADYEGWHLGAGMYVGERMFAVMYDGLRVQHHAMSFDQSYIVGISKEFGDMLLTTRYIKQYGNEVPVDNDNVEVSNVSVNFEYRF